MEATRKAITKTEEERLSGTVSGPTSRPRRKKRKKKFHLKDLFVRGTYFDYPTLFLILFLCGFGLMMVYSASSFVAQRDYGNSMYFLKRQALVMLAGFVAMAVLSKVRYQVYKKITVILMVVEFILLVATLIGGSSANGSTRWLGAGGVKFQASELAKLILPMYMAQACTAQYEKLMKLKTILKILWMPGAIILLIAVENLTTALICAAIIGAIWVVATPKFWQHILPVVLVAAAGVLYFILGTGYRGERIQVWRHPERYEKGYQTMQSLYAVGSGGLFGKGLGQSVQKMGFIPEAQNDMIFSIICEELGIVGGIGLLMVFLLLVWRLKFLADAAKERFGSLMVVGYMTHIAVQVLINVGVNTNAIPNTGVTLPFISYGGSSLIVLMMEMGVVLSVSRQIEPYADRKKGKDTTEEGAPE